MSLRPWRRRKNGSICWSSLYEIEYPSRRSQPPCAEKKFKWRRGIITVLPLCRGGHQEYDLVSFNIGREVPLNVPAREYGSIIPVKAVDNLYRAVSTLAACSSTGIKV